MKRFLIASVAVLGLAGVAAAQQAPVNTGNYDAAVSQSLNNTNGNAISGGVDYSTTRSISTDRGVNAGNAGTVVHSDNYGR